MRVSVKRYFEEDIEVEGSDTDPLAKTYIEVETGKTQLASVIILQEALSVSAELASHLDETIPANPPIIKKYMPRIAIAYLFDEIAEAPFLKGERFAEKCRAEDMLSFEKPPANSLIARIKFKNESPEDEVLQKMNAILLSLGEVISKEIDKTIADICEEMKIDAADLEQMPAVHWVVCDEFPESGSELFPDRD